MAGPELDFLAERLRSLWTARGGFAVEGSDLLSGVLRVGDFENLPHLWHGPVIPRDFAGVFAASAVVGEIGFAGIRCSNDRALIHLKRVIVTNPSAVASTFVYGRRSSITYDSAGSASYRDTRLPLVALSPDPIDIGGGTDVGVVAAASPLRVTIPAGDTKYLEVDYRLVSGANLTTPAGAPEAFTIAGDATNTAVRIGFEGTIWDFIPNPR